MSLKIRVFLVLALSLLSVSASANWFRYTSGLSESGCNTDGQWAAANQSGNFWRYTAYRCDKVTSTQYDLFLWNSTGSTPLPCGPNEGTWNQQTSQCELPPEPDPCPEKGTTTSKTYEIKVGMSESYCRDVMIEGCPHSLCDKGAKPVALDESGNNCEAVPDDPTMLNCFVRPVALEPVERCTGEDCPIGPEEVTESKPVGNPEISTELNTDPNTGDTKTTEKETTRQVNPDGSSTQTETTTEVKTDSTGTTTTVRTDTKTRNPDGTTTTTTVEEVTGPDNVTKTTISGSSQTGDGLEKAFDSECDPESRDYLQCVGMLEEIGDSQSADLISEIDQAGDDVIGNYESGMNDLFSVMESPDEPSVLVDLVNNFIPSSSGCNDFGFTWNAYTFTVPCSRLAPLREWFGWMLSVLSVISIFYIALRPQH